MVVGFNHNFRYKGTVYHVQTEDRGLKTPQIVTHLFSGGTILASRKTSYLDIVKTNNLEQVVEELMKEQHREMLRRLKSGELDQVIRERLGSEALAQSAEAQGAAKPETVEPRPASAPVAEVPRAVAAPITPSPPAPAAPADVEPDLDDIILSYLLGDGGNHP